MPTPMPAADVLDREFLQIRAKILELAASFDRLSRGSGSVADDPRLKQIREALAILEASGQDRAEQVQLVFSRSYQRDWRERMGIKAFR